MKLTSVILIVDRYFEDQEIIVENLKKANSSFELLVYNNFGNVIPELKEMSTKFLQSNSIIELNFAECVNSLLPYCTGDYICILYDYGYLFDNWLLNCLKTHTKIDQSGVVGIMSSEQHTEMSLSIVDNQICQFLNNEDELEFRYCSDNLVDGIVLFSKELLSQLGGLNTNLNQKYVFWEYSYRAGTLGKYNYYNIEDYIIKISEYTSAYSSTKKEYTREIKTNEIFKILNPDIDYNQIIQELRANQIEAEYTKKMNCVYVIDKSFDQELIEKISEICKKNNFTFEVICTGYYVDYLWKGRVAILIKNIL